MEGFTFVVTLAVYVVIAAAAFGLAFWAYAARRDRPALVGLYVVFGFPAFLLTAAGLALVVSGNRAAGIPVLAIGLSLGLPLLKPVRRLLAAVTPLDPDSPVNMMGLVAVLTGTVVLTVLNQAAMTMLTETEAAGGGGEAFSFSVGIPDLVLQGAWWVVVSYAAVGLWIVRSLPEATARLGITRPTWRVIGVAIGFLALTYLVATVIGLVAQWIQPDASTDVEQIVEQLTANVQNPLGALALGLSAGIGEEAIFRGALQPRYGIVLTAIAFAALHTGQYGFNFSAIAIFLIGILFGIERQRYGTTAAMITHALFDIVQVLALTLAS